MNDCRRLEAIVEGRVQGVGFRWFVRRAAADLGLYGWVANERSGSVRVVVEGESGALEELVARLRLGPPGASVENVDRRIADATGEFAGFEIRAGAHSGD